MHRLGIAGYRGPRLFARDAVKLLFRASRGVPRLINILAHKSLLAVYGEGGHYVTDKFVRLAIVDTESARQRAAGRRLWLLRIGTALAAIAVFSIGAWLWVARA
jgi:MSHA biogenesis protein MshM